MTDDQTQNPQAGDSRVDIRGEIERVIYRGENGYTVASVLTEDLGKVTMVGMMPPVTEGMRLQAVGEKYWKADRGWQYKVLSFQEDGFTSEDALIKYLSSPSFPDIGKSFAKQVVARFGMDTLDVLDNSPEKLKAVPGLSQAKASKLIKMWDEQRQVHHLMTELMGYGLTLNMATKVSKMLGPTASAILRVNPYRLTEVPSIGFVRADEIARRMGVPQNSPFRIAAAIMHVMDRSQLDGDCYKSKGDVAAIAQELLQAGMADTKGLGIMDVSNQIGALCQRGALVGEGTRLYTAHLYFAEKFCAEAIQEMMAHGHSQQFYPTIEVLDADLDRLGGGLTFAPEQKQALMTALNERVVIITGGPGVGKALAHDAPVATPQGWSPISGLKVGDSVIGSDGKPCRVLGVYPQGVKDLYRVTFSDGSSVECCEDHLWSLQTKRSRAGGKTTVWTTAQIMERLGKVKSGQRARLYVPMISAPVQYAASDEPLPLDPYLLGALIGDGSMSTAKGVAFTSVDEYMLRRVSGALPEGVALVRQGKDRISYSITAGRFGARVGRNPVLNALRDLGLQGHGSWSKFIPDSYLRADAESRAELLRGLMDTDGTVGGNQNYSFSTVSHQLALDVVEIAQSLGCKASCRVKNGTYKGERHQSYRVGISPPPGLPIFSLPRKADVCRPREKYMPIRAIRSVEFTRRDEAVCIMVDSPDSLFCTKDFILTHNTTVTRALCDLFDKNRISYELCSPTGRAAKRLMEATGRTARTIHRLLKPSKEGEFQFNEANPLQTNAVIVDETSMVDVSLFKHLLSAMETDDRLVLIGDADQLPSVGAGNVLRDLIRSKAVPTVRLQRIFRQSSGSDIVQAAHGVLNGIVPDLPTPAESNGRTAMLVAAKEVGTLTEYIKTMVAISLPAAGFDPNDIQVITPMREKGLGIHDLNPVLQEALNPPHPNKPQAIIGSRIFRLGDRVMQLQNDYEKDVFNGDQGLLASVVNNDGSISLGVSFQGKDDPTIYTGTEIDALMHAYAITVHRSQGSEYPAVVLVLHDSQRAMLQRNLFYTAMTRAKKMLIVTGSVSSMTMAVNNETAHKRNTALFEWLTPAAQAAG